MVYDNASKVTFDLTSHLNTMIGWCYSTFGQVGGKWDILTTPEHRKVFYFEREEDATMFRLRWDGVID